MVLIPLGTSDWRSEDLSVPRLRLHNMYIAENPNSPDGVSRVSRPGTTTVTNIGTGPIVGMFQEEGVIDSTIFVVSGTELYYYRPGTDAILIGNIPGSGFCNFAATPDRLIIVRDGTAYSTDGVTVTTIVMPDDVPGYEGSPAPVGSVAMINSFFILTVLNSGRFYWIIPGGTDPDPLDFATAERFADGITSVNITSDEIWFLGVQGPEVWQTQDDPDAPFIRIAGRVYNEGCVYRDAVIDVTSDHLPAIIWVTPLSSVVMAQGNVQTISDDSVEEFLRDASNLRAWSFRHQRHDFYVLTGDAFTVVYDLQMKKWLVWDSYGRPNFLAHLGCQVDPVVYAGSSIDNTIYQLGNAFTDDGVNLVREVSGVIFNPTHPIPCASVLIRTAVGATDDPTFEPIIEMRWSNDLGKTWSNYRQISMGKMGNYTKDTVQRSLGRIARPGRVFEFRCTDPVQFRLDYAVMNEVL